MFHTLNTGTHIPRALAKQYVTSLVEAMCMLVHVYPLHVQRELHFRYNTRVDSSTIEQITRTQPKHLLWQATSCVRLAISAI